MDGVDGHINYKASSFLFLSDLRSFIVICLGFFLVLVLVALPAGSAFTAPQGTNTHNRSQNSNSKGKHAVSRQKNKKST